MTIPTFNNKDPLESIRAESINPTIETTNLLEARRGEVTVNGELSKEIEIGSGLKTELGVNVTKISQDLTKSAWPIVKVSFGDSPLVIDDESQMGIEYEFSVTPQFSGSVHLYRSLPEGSKIKVSLDNESLFNPDVKPVEVFQIYEGAKTHYWYVKTPTVFTLHEGFWRSDESGQMMHIREATSFDDSGAKIDVIHGIAVDPDSNLTSLVDEKGVLTLSLRTGKGDGEHLPLTGGTLTGPLIIDTNQEGKVFEVTKLDDTPLIQAVNVGENSLVGYRKTPQEIEESLDPFEVVNKSYTNTHYVRRDGGWVAGDVVVMPYSAYVMGSEFMTKVDYLHLNTGTTLSTGDISYNQDTGSWEGDFVDFGEMKDDHLQLNKLRIVGDSGTLFDINDKVKFWSSGAIELTGYSNFKDNELVTKAYVDGKVGDGGGGGSYSGEGLGVPEGVFFTTGTVDQSSPVGLYYNALNDGSSRGNIELNNDEGYNEFNVIIQGLNRPTRDWRIGAGMPGRYSDKTIRPGETWQCRVYVDWNVSSNTNFFWTRLDDGSSLFDAVDVSSFDSNVNHLPLKKAFTNRDHISIPVELEEGMTIIVREVLCHKEGKITREPFEYSHENGILRVHLENVCSGTIIAELVK